MQITNQGQNNTANTQNQRPLNLQKDEIYRAKIKSKSSQSQATLSIRGQEVNVKFKGNAPSSGEVNIQVTNNKSQPYEVKAVSTSSSDTKASDLTKILSKFEKGPVSGELKQAAKQLLDNGLPLNKNTIQSLKNYLHKSSGTMQQKLEVIKTIASKGINVNESSLKAVHQMLNGPKFSTSLKSIAEAINPNFKHTNQAQDVLSQLKSIQNRIQGQENISTTVKQLSEVIKNPNTSSSVRDQMRAALKEVEAQLQNNNHKGASETLAKAVDRAIHTVQNQKVSQGSLSQSSGLDLQHAKEQVKQAPTLSDAKQVVDKLLTKQAGKEVNQILQQALKQVAHMQSNGLTQTGKQVLNQAIDKAIQMTQGTAWTSGNQPTNQASSSSTANQTLSNQTSQQSNTSQNTAPSTSAASFIKQVKSAIQKSPNMEEVLRQSKEALQEVELHSDVRSKVERSMEQATSLNNGGKELAARKELYSQMEQIEKTLPRMDQNTETSNPQKSTEAQHYEINELLQAGQSIKSKEMLVETVTKKLSQMTMDFRDTKRNISRNLDNVQNMLQQNMNKQQAPKAESLLQSTIKQLDQAILKSDMMLYADMKTEKSLMEASGRLAEAQKLLDKGQFQQAKEIVNKVQELVDRVQFNPSDKKVKRFIASQSLPNVSADPKEAFLNEFKEVSKHFTQTQGSGREVFENIKRLGLNHDAELARALMAKSNGMPQDVNQKNMKAILMQLMNDPDSNGKVSQQADQALNHLTGQQLMNKADNSQNLQTLFFSLPLLLGEQTEDLNVYINSKNEGEKIDWENCNLYFLIDTKKLGEVGIKLNVSNRHLDITLKNDEPSFPKVMAPIAQITEQKLEEIGYVVNGISFTKMNQSSGKQNDSNPQTSEPLVIQPSQATKRGVDFSV